MLEIAQGVLIGLLCGTFISSKIFNNTCLHDDDVKILIVYDQLVHDDNELRLDYVALVKAHEELKSFCPEAHRPLKTK